jgi:Fic family protein
VGWGWDDDSEDERTLREGAKGVAQARRVSALIGDALRSGTFALTPEIICDLHEHAMRGIIPTAGQLRIRSDVVIDGSQHIPPPHGEVPGLVADACDFVNTSPGDPIFIAAYVLWRICWIHPFDDGNGRTARAASYLALSVRLGFEPGGEPWRASPR